MATAFVDRDRVRELLSQLQITQVSEADVTAVMALTQARLNSLSQQGTAAPPHTAPSRRPAASGDLPPPPVFSAPRLVAAADEGPTAAAADNRPRQTDAPHPSRTHPSAAHDDDAAALRQLRDEYLRQYRRQEAAVGRIGQPEPRGAAPDTARRPATASTRRPLSSRPPGDLPHSDAAAAMGAAPTTAPSSHMAAPHPPSTLDDHHEGASADYLHQRRFDPTRELGTLPAQQQPRPASARGGRPSSARFSTDPSPSANAAVNASATTSQGLAPARDSAGGVLYAEMGAKLYLTRRRGPLRTSDPNSRFYPNSGQATTAAKPLWRRSDPVKRGEAMRQLWDRNEFLTKKDERNFRWQVRRDMLKWEL